MSSAVKNCYLKNHHVLGKEKQERKYSKPVTPTAFQNRNSAALLSDNLLLQKLSKANSCKDKAFGHSRHGTMEQNGSKYLTQMKVGLSEIHFHLESSDFVDHT